MAQEKDWPHATLNRLKKLENAHRVLRTEFMALREDMSENSLIAVLKDIAKAIRETNTSGGITPEQQARLDALKKSADANDAAVADALKNRAV